MTKQDKIDHYGEIKAHRERKMPRLTLRMIDGELIEPKQKARQKPSPLQPASERVE